ncbi:HBS1-like protein isoform X2 [Mixophyes fleayi]|uniref:HBS1-like protein isoform X2 n=1 Tax=Mixophyes fleayi TaxID=3061075 RepID=UPI003F4E09C0
MARHRNVRGYNYDDDFDDDDLYGQSVEDDYCISPATAAQFIYSKRNRHSSFTEPLEEEVEDEDVNEEQDKPRASHTALSSVDQARLFSCLDHMREVLGESVSEQIMIDAAMQCQFDVPKALDLVFKQDCNTSMKPLTQDFPPTVRPAKGALFTSLHSLCDNQAASYPLLNNSKYTECSQTGIISGVLTDDKKENILLDITSSLSLSSLISESSDENFCSVKPVTLSGMSLFDLISNPTGNSATSEELDLSLTKLSGISPCHSEQIPGLKQLQTDHMNNRSLNLEKCKDSVTCEGVSNFQEISFPKCIGPEENHLLVEQTHLFGSLSSVLQSENNYSSDGENWSVPSGENLSVPKYGSPSLADLIQEYKQRNSLQDLTLNAPQRNLCNTELQTGSLVSLSQLCKQPNTISSIPSLTTSLSSLAQASDLGETQVSLSTLTVEADEPVHDGLLGVFQSNTVHLTETDTNIDLRFLISEPVDSDKSSSLLTKPTTCKQLDSKQSSQKYTHPEKMIISEKCDHWVKSLKAKPSAFALSMCFTYIPKACTKTNLMIHQDRQNDPVTVTSELGQPAPIPFNFQTPSPDDIVKESQKKAFMR